MIKAFLFSILLISATTISFSQNVPTGTRLKDIPSSCKIGVQIGSTGMGISQCKTIAEREYNAITATWFPNWGGWKAPDSYYFNALNNEVNWSNSRGKTTIMAMLVGADMYMPSWFLDGTWTDAEMDAMLQNMIYALLESNDNKTKLNVINVANELFDDNGKYKTMKWNQLGWEADASGLTGIDKVNTQHPVFIAKAFQYCRDKSDAKLELRDYNIEIPNSANPFRGWAAPHHRAVYQLIKHLIAKGVPIDAIGIQGHYKVGAELTSIMPGFAAVTKKFINAGVEVYITELDMQIAGQTWDATLANQQKIQYKDVVTTYIKAGAKIINLWGVADGVDKGWLTTEHPCLFDESYNPKPAYYGVQDALTDITSSNQILNIDNAQLLMYPNPVVDKFTLVSSDIVLIRIVDMQGRLMLEKRNCAATETFDLAGFPKGIYFLQAKTSEKTSAVKLFKN